MQKQRIKNRNLKETSKKWLQRQLNDPFVQQAKAAGYRSRASFKILEIQNKFKIFDKSKIVLELGSAPGGWSQIIAPLVAKVVAIDLLPMAPISGVTFIQGDFMDETNIHKILATLGNVKVDYILSDIAPNASGNKTIDQLKMQGIIEMILEIIPKVLINNGGLVAKVYQSAINNSIKQVIDRIFCNTQFFKPKSSRPESQEIYWICKGYKNIV